MSKLFGYLSYRDVEVAITLLEALGFETTTRQQDDGGATVHAELRLGDAVVMVAPADEPYEMPKLIGRSTATASTSWSTTSPHSMGRPCRRAAAASSHRTRPSGERPRPRAAPGPAEGPIST